MMHTARACLLSIATILITTPSRADELRFDQLGADFLAARGLEQGSADLEQILARGFVHLELGAYELFYPQAALSDEEAHLRFQRACVAVLDTHGTWLKWADPAHEQVSPKEVEADADVLRKWIKGWKAKDLAAVEAGKDLGLALDRKDREQAALARFNTSLLSAGLPPSPGVTASRARFVLVPDRRTFVSFAAAMGLVHEDLRSVYWTPGVAGWIEFRFEDTRIAALEFGGLDPKAWETGLPMNVRNERGLEEQIAQLAFGSLVLQRFGNRIDPDFSNALCNNLVIDQYGEVDTRSDGDLRPRTAPPRKVFVPGGLSEGGVLPPNDADSPWRATRGADRFLAVLAQAQALGAKEAGDKKTLNAFLLHADDGVATCIVRAPFFGAAAASTTPPPETFRGDWLELQRAYRVAFCHWLHEQAAGKAGSPKAFAAVLARLAPESEEIDFAAELEAAFGAPVSAAPPGPEDLEGRFLGWLAKRK
jgi:hypothetical protein